MNKITKQENTQTQSVAVSKTGLQIQTMDELWRFSKAVQASGFAPKGLEKVEAIFVAIQMGMELEIPPMAALQNIGVINGRPGIYGDAALALIRRSGLLESYHEEEVGTRPGDDWGIRVVVKRKGHKQADELFTVADAKTARLWGKQGPWSQYPKRMLKFRARGFILRDQFGDVLKGFKTTEELEDQDEHKGFDNAKDVTSKPLFKKEIKKAKKKVKVIETYEPELTASELELLPEPAVAEPTGEEPTGEEEKLDIVLLCIKHNISEKELLSWVFRKGMTVTELGSVEDFQLEYPKKVNQIVRNFDRAKEQIRSQRDAS